MRPDAVDYLVRKHEDQEKSNQLKLNPIKEVDSYLDTDSELKDEQSIDHYQVDGGDFWEEIETKIKVPDGLQLPQTSTAV
jgi:hypothetical protein